MSLKLKEVVNLIKSKKATATIHKREEIPTPEVAPQQGPKIIIEKHFRVKHASQKQDPLSMDSKWEQAPYHPEEEEFFLQHHDDYKVHKDMPPIRKEEHKELDFSDKKHEVKEEHNQIDVSGHKHHVMKEHDDKKHDDDHKKHDDSHKKHDDTSKKHDEHKSNKKEESIKHKHKEESGTPEPTDFDPILYQPTKVNSVPTSAIFNAATTSFFEGYGIAAGHAEDEFGGLGLIGVFEDNLSSDTTRLAVNNLFIILILIVIYFAHVK